MKFIKRKYVFGIIYSLFLIGLITYVLLDTFVIPKVGVVVDNNIVNENNDTSLVNNDSINATITDTSYTDANISINITTERNYDTNIYIVDIKLSSIDYLKTAFASNTFGRNITAKTSSIASSNGAILAINGDYYGFRTSGFVLRNGTIYRSTSNNSEDLVIYNNGSFGIVEEDSTNLNNLLNNGALQVFSFGPALVKNSVLSVTSNSEVAMAKSSNPRTAIGIIDNLHYIIVVSDGRTSTSEGLSLYELASVLKEEGCVTAYNLDGGGSSTLWFNGNVINNPTDGNSLGERKISDIIYVGY